VTAFMNRACVSEITASFNVAGRNEDGARCAVKDKKGRIGSAASQSASGILIQIGRYAKGILKG
jgi:hypothetical protein